MSCVFEHLQPFSQLFFSLSPRRPPDLALSEDNQVRAGFQRLPETAQAEKTDEGEEAKATQTRPGRIRPNPMTNRARCNMWGGTSEGKVLSPLARCVELARSFSVVA